jgi:hypothetical protein
MQGLRRLQLIGPLVLLCAVGAAEAASRALASDPTSALLWYLNLELFSIFRKSGAFLDQYGSVPFAQLLFVALLAVLIVAGLARRSALPAAIASNLSFVYAGFLLYSWHHWNSLGQVRAASLAPVQVPAGSTLYLFVSLLLASFVSFAASHYFYLRLLRSR